MRIAFEAMEILVLGMKVMCKRCFCWEICRFFAKGYMV